MALKVREKNKDILVFSLIIACSVIIAFLIAYLLKFACAGLDALDYNYINNNLPGFLPWEDFQKETSETVFYVSFVVLSVLFSFISFVIFDKKTKGITRLNTAGSENGGNTSETVLQKESAETDKFINFFKADKMKILALVVFIALEIFLFYFLLITNFSMNYFTAYHTSAYLASLFDVLNGGALYVDTYSIYGNFAYIIAPLFKLISFSRYSIGIVYSLLCCIVLFNLTFFSYRILKDIRQALGVALVLILTGFLFGISYNSGIYYQYMPHRILFPSLFLLLITFYNEDKLKSKLIVYFTICVSLIWNFESGLFILLTFFVYNVYLLLTKHGFSEKKLYLKILPEILFSIIAFLLSFLYVIIISKIISGVWINISAFFNTYGISSQLGISMLPLKEFPVWPIFMLVPAVYLIASIISISKIRHFNGESNLKHKINLLLSVYGLLVFTYYIGRSHVYNIPPTLWPFVIVVFFNFYGVAKYIFSKFYINFKKIAAYFFIAVFFAYTAGFGAYLLFAGCTGTYINLKNGYPRDFTDTENFFRENIDNFDGYASIAVIHEYYCLCLSDLNKENDFMSKINADMFYWIYTKDIECFYDFILEYEKDFFILSERAENILKNSYPEKFALVEEKYPVRIVENKKMEDKYSANKVITIIYKK